MKNIGELSAPYSAASAWVPPCDMGVERLSNLVLVNFGLSIRVWLKFDGP